MQLGEFLRSLSLKEYISHFGRYQDPITKNIIKFNLWPKQEEYCDFLDLEPFSLTPKSRQNGASEIAAERALKELMQYPRTEGVVISKGKDFAEYFLERRILIKYNNLPKSPGIVWPKITKITKESIEWDNGSKLKSIASTSTSAASMTLDFLIFDEAGGIDENNTGVKFEDLYNNAEPALMRNPRAWYMIIGTSVPGSFYNEMVERSYNGEDTENKIFFLPYNIDPEKTEEWWLRQKNKKKDAVYTQYPRTMDDFFHVRDGLVFKNFDAREEGDHVKRFQPRFTYQFITAYDHGTIHPACYLFTLYDQYSDHLYVFDEIYYQKNHQTPISKICYDYKRKLQFLPVAPYKQIADTAIFARRDGPLAQSDIFKKYGVRFTKSHKYDEASSRDMLSERFTHNKITIAPNCVNLIKELRSYRWNSNRAGEEAEDKNNDAIDPLRYICAEIRKQSKPTKVDPSEPYSEQKRKNTERARSRFKNMLSGTNSSSFSDKDINSWQGV